MHFQMTTLIVIANTSSPRPPYPSNGKILPAKHSPYPCANTLLTLQVESPHQHHKKTHTVLHGCKILSQAKVSSYRPLHPLDEKTPPAKQKNVGDFTNGTSTPNVKNPMMKQIFKSSYLQPFCLLGSLLISPLGEVTPVPNPSAGTHSLFPNFFQIFISFSPCNTYVFKERCH